MDEDVVGRSSNRGCHAACCGFPYLDGISGEGFDATHENLDVYVTRLYCETVYLRLLRQDLRGRQGFVFSFKERCQDLCIVVLVRRTKCATWRSRSSEMELNLPA